MTASIMVSRLRLFLTFLGLFATVLLILGLQSGDLELRIVLVNTSQPLLVLPMRAHERFTLHYYHSVENAPIWEVHSVDEKGRIYIEEERYLKFGAGMGRMPNVGRMVYRPPYEIIEDMHFPTSDFVLRIGSPGVDHTIIWRGVSVNLTELAAGEVLEVRGRSVSLIASLWRRLAGNPDQPTA